MAFTDDNLKRLKDKNIGVNSGKPYAQVIANREEFEALLARLEAAEAYIEGEEYWAGPGDWKNALEAWRKAAGK